jgi:nicotinamidase-related amidase
VRTKIISIDFQKEFTEEGGFCYRDRPSVIFMKEVLIPYVIEHNIKMAEIISDYRQPRPSTNKKDYCVPGTIGYESEIPADAKKVEAWIKCANSPIWIRDNIGDASKQPGHPYQAPQKFNDWIASEIDSPEETEILLVGLTLDCCVLCSAQEFRARGYKVKIIKDAVDTFSGDQTEKESLCKTPLYNWAEVVSWEEVKDSI